MIDAAAIDALDALESCPCCLLGPQQRCLFTPYTHLEQTEIYSDMLKESFGIQLNVSSDKCGICEECVVRLRDASHFKRQVRRSQAQLRARLERALRIIDVEPAAAVKSEPEDYEETIESLPVDEPPGEMAALADKKAPCEDTTYEQPTVKMETANDGEGRDHLSDEKPVGEESASDEEGDRDGASEDCVAAMDSYQLTVPAPAPIKRQVIKPLMCGPGPCDLWPSAAEALNKPVISPACDEYYNVMADIRVGLQYLFQTRSKLVLAVSGSGHAGLETIISNLLAPGELLLVPFRAIWDERACDIARRYGIRVETIETSAPFTTFSLEEIEAALKKHRPAGLFITHGDSSTGTVQDMRGLGELCHKYGALLLVDTVVSVGAEPVLMDEWGADAVYAACQKALGGPAGIAPVAFSARAEAKINSRTHEPPFYFDVKLLARQWRCYEDTFYYHHTLSPPLLWALRSCLEELATETLPNTWARHAAVTAHFHRRLNEHGFEFLVKNPEERLVSVTTVQLPEGDLRKFVQHMREKHNIMISPGLGPTAGKAVRVGIMAVHATEEMADRVADAMAETARVCYLNFNKK